MKREDFERLKEEEKRHLLEIRALKQQLKDAQRLQRIGEALHDIESAGALVGFDRSLEDVQRDAAEQEARLDLAVGNTGSLESSDLQEEDEETLKMKRAADFVRQMKIATGRSADVAEMTPAGSSAASDPSEGTEEPVADEQSFEKTIGRMTPREKKK